jgi:hypothetical protein
VTKVPVEFVAPVHENVTVDEEVRVTPDGHAFSILSKKRQIMSLAFETGDDAEQARANFAKAFAEATNNSRKHVAERRRSAENALPRIRRSAASPERVILRAGLPKHSAARLDAIG